MEETTPKSSNRKRGMWKKTKLTMIIVIAVAIGIIFIMGGAYAKFKKNLNELAETQEEYEKSIKLTPEGITSDDSETQESSRVENLNVQMAAVIEKQERYNRIANMEANSLQKLSDQNYNLTNQILLAEQELEIVEKKLIAAASTTEGTKKSKAEELASEIVSLGDYLDDSPTQTKEQKLAYLMNAGLVNKYPYIESIADDDTKLNGTIKFYRYLSSLEEGASGQIQLTFIDKASFDKKLEDYKTSGNQEVYNYFTIDEDENVLIAYGTKTTKTIKTTDNEVSLGTISEISAETYSKTGEGTYVAETYTINTKQIDYQSLVEPYVLPFNLLATLLIQTRNYSMVKEIADLAYNSEIVIGIYDNKSITSNKDEYVYNKKIKYTENTKLVFDNVSTDPQVNISTSKYSEVVKECFGKLDETRQKSIHCSGINLADLETATGNRTDGKVYEAYIAEISEEGIVTKISNTATEFKTTFNVRTVANAAPTVGVTLADVWAGKWTSTYVEEPDSKDPVVTTSTLDDEQLDKVENSKFAQELLAEDGSIGTNLKSHSEQLKEKAIEKIIEKTTFTIAPKAMTGAHIRSHAKGCTECAATLTAHFGLFWRVENTNSRLYIEAQKLLDYVKNGVEDEEEAKKEARALIKKHVEEALQKEATEKTRQRKEKFIKDITEQITYEQWATIYKGNQSIKQNNTYSKDSTTYKKDSTNMEDEGKKFAKILSKSKYRTTKEAILTREAWFWDSIRQHEETAKIENLLRYLFNIAFKTTAFGTFTEDEIRNLFQMFEPKEQTSFVTVGGGIRKYLLQFGGNETTYEFDGISYYKMYTDAASDQWGNPTLGAGDIQWKSNHDKFNLIGTVRLGGAGGTTYSNCNVQQQVNTLLGRI